MKQKTAPLTSTVRITIRIMRLILRGLRLWLFTNGILEDFKRLLQGLEREPELGYPGLLLGEQEGVSGGLSGLHEGFKRLIKLLVHLRLTVKSSLSSLK